MKDRAHPAFPGLQAAANAPVAWARPLYLRHAPAVRIMHWTNVVALTLMLMSGLQIFNAHPALYWGNSSYSGRPAWLEIGAKEDAQGNPIGYTRVLGHEFNTTGVLGLSTDGGQMFAQGFPSWLTVASHQWLAMARSWHFFFAWIFLINGLCYVAYTLWSRHLARDLLPTHEDVRGIGASIGDHLRFRHPTGEAAERPNAPRHRASPARNGGSGKNAWRGAANVSFRIWTRLRLIEPGIFLNV